VGVAAVAVVVGVGVGVEVGLVVEVGVAVEVEVVVAVEVALGVDDDVDADDREDGVAVVFAVFGGCVLLHGSGRHAAASVHDTSIVAATLVFTVAPVRRRGSAPRAPG
jgi:hypothetical protein